MSTNTKRLLAGSALAGVAVLSVGAPALAATRTAKHHTHVPTTTAVPTAAPVPVEIGTAVQYVRNADGTISMVHPH